MDILVDPTNNKKYEDAMVKEKCIILDGVKDHVIPDIVEKNKLKEMWDTLTKFYHGTSMQ